jgi:hypothetical protein
MLDREIQKQNKINSNKDKLIAAIKEEFPLRNYWGFEEFFPFCNDYGFAKIIKILSQYQANKTQKETVSLVFGESNFISLLPALSNISDVLLLADINPVFHKHNQFLLDCFVSSSNPKEFENIYFRDKNPGLGCRMPFLYQPFTRIILDKNIEFSRRSVGKSHFLNNQESFDKCKMALNKMVLVPIYFNVSKTESCLKLNSLLHQYNAELNFCNFTNIGEYDEKLKNKVELLLKGHENAFILSSSRDRDIEDDGFPRSIISCGLKDFLSTDINKAYTQFDKYIKHMNNVDAILNKESNKKMLYNHFYFEKPLPKVNSKLYGRSYVAVFSCNESQMRNIVSGSLDINSFPVSLAHDNEADIKNSFSDVLFKIKNSFDNEADFKNKFSYFLKINNEFAGIFNCEGNLNDYWVVNFLRNKEKVSRYLRTAKSSSHDLRDERINNHLKISSYIMGAEKMDGSAIISSLANSKSSFFSAPRNPLIKQQDEIMEQENLLKTRINQF